MATKKRSKLNADKDVLSIDELNDDSPSSSDLSQCFHGVRDDKDCVDCRTAGCGGGGDCSCGDKESLENSASDSRIF